MDILNDKFVVVDLETSGLDKNRDYIIELGAVKIVNGKIKDKYSTLVLCPQMQSLPKEVEELTEIHYEELKKAPAIGEVLKQFYEFANGCTLVAHNLPFDFAFLRNWGFWCGVWFDEFEKFAIDTIELAKQVLGDKVANYKLCTIAKHFGIEFAHHRALSDAEATAKIFLELANSHY